MVQPKARRSSNRRVRNVLCYFSGGVGSLAQSLGFVEDLLKDDGLFEFAFILQ